ncbi:hypothetical protein GCM10020256_56340 [Streptomyces thermocoprophilus]
MQRSRIAIAGSSGLIGGALAASLEAEGHEVVRLVRRAPREPGEVRWDPERGSVDAAGLEGCDAVVNLAGGGHRQPAVDGELQGADPFQPGGRHTDAGGGGGGTGQAAAGVRERQRDRPVRRHG